MSDSQETWAVESLSVIDSVDHEDRDHMHFVVCQEVIVAQRLRKEDAERIVACVNACRGAPLEALQKAGAGDFYDLAVWFAGVCDKDLRA